MRDPTHDHLRKLGQEAGLSNGRINEIMDQTCDALSKWEDLATQYGVSASSVALIKSKIKIRN